MSSVDIGRQSVDTECGYNPYTGEWAEWSTNPLKQKAIDFYGMREMVDEMNKNGEE